MALNQFNNIGVTSIIFLYGDDLSYSPSVKATFPVQHQPIGQEEMITLITFFLLHVGFHFAFDIKQQFDIDFYSILSASGSEA